MKLTGKFESFYRLGINAAERFDSEREALEAMIGSGEIDYFAVSAVGFDQFFHAGFVGREPEWVEAYRYGELPDAGRSINYAEDKWEPGVSVVKIIRGETDEEYADGTLYNMLGREKIRVAGWYLGNVGSDGEPTLLGCVKIG